MVTSMRMSEYSKLVCRVRVNPVTRAQISLASVYLMGFYNVSWVWVLSLQSSNVAGMTKNSFASVSVGVCYGRLSEY